METPRSFQEMFDFKMPKSAFGSNVANAWLIHRSVALTHGGSQFGNDEDEEEAAGNGVEEEEGEEDDMFTPDAKRSRCLERQEPHQRLDSSAPQFDDLIPLDIACGYFEEVYATNMLASQPQYQAAPFHGDAVPLSSGSYAKPCINQPFSQSFQGQSVSVSGYGNALSWIGDSQSSTTLLLDGLGQASQSVGSLEQLEPRSSSQ